MKRKLIFPILAAILIILGFVVFNLPGSDPNPVVETPPTTVKPALTPVQALLNKPIQDGSFTFTVRSVKCGINRAGPSDPYAVHALPQGQFCFLDVRVDNATDKQVEYTSDGHYLVNLDGTKYAPDLYSTSLINNPWKKVDPKKPIDVTIVFDIPKGAKLASAELRGGNASSGITLALKN